MSTTADPVTPTPAGNDSSNSGAIVPALPPTTTLTPADLAVAKDKLAKGGKTAEQTQADLTAAWSSIASAMMDAQTKLQSNPNDPSLKDQVTALQKQKKDLEDFMLDNHVSLPSSSLADAFKGVGWAEVYQATYLILHATDLCFEILKYAPLPEDLANAPIIAPDEKQDKQIDDQVAKDVDKAFNKDEAPANGDAKPEDKPTDKPADKPAEKPETPANGTSAPAPPAQPVIPHDKPLVDPKKVAETWEKIRDSIVLVLKTSKPQLDNLFQVVDTVSRLGKRFNEFLQFVPTVEKYNVAPEHLQFVREVIADLNALAGKVESDTGKYFAAVVDDSSVLLKQAGQEYLKANADTVTEGEIQYSKLEGQLLTLYDDEIKSRDLIAYKKGEVAGLILRRDLTVQRVISLKESKATLLAQSNALSKAIQEKSTSFNDELKKMSDEISNNRKTVAANQQARIDKARERGEKEKADIQKQIADLQKQLDATPPTVNQVSTVRNSGFIGIGASSSTTTTPIENPAYKAINDRMKSIKANESQTLTAAANIDRNYTEDQNKWEDKYITTQQEELTRLQGNQEAYSKKLAQMKTEVDAQIKDIDTQIVTLQGTSDTVADAASAPSVTPATTTPAPAPGAGPVISDADDAPPVFTEGSLLNKLEAQITTGKATLENLTANLETKHANLQDQEKRIRASMSEWKKNIDAAKRKRDTAIANYGMTPGSDASVKATYDLLSKLLMLPKTIDLNVDHFINFKRQILDMVKNVSTGLTSIENGANKLPPFAPTRIGVRNWLNAIDKYDTATKLYTKSIDRKALQAYDKDPKMADRINKMANLDDDDQFVMGLYLPDYINNEYDPDTYRADDWKLQFETGLRIVAQNLLSLNVVVEVLQPQLTSVQNNKDTVKLK